MTSKRNQTIKNLIRDYTEKHTKTPEEALATMVREGIYDITGRLMPEYCNKILDVFATGREFANDMFLNGEIEPIQNEIWDFAEKSIVAFGLTPMVSPLQMGGVCCEWHNNDMNIEINFRGIMDIFVVIEDARNKIPNFYGCDATLERAKQAIQEINKRS
jgi:hypothetical protein